MAHPEFMEINQHKLAYYIEQPQAPRTPLVLIHGFFGSWRFFTEGLPEELRHNRMIVHLSLPGHYPSYFPIEDVIKTSFVFCDLYGQAISRLCGGKKVFLLGHSTGAFISLQLGAFWPQLFKGVIPVCPFVEGRWASLEGDLQALACLQYMGLWLFKAALMIWSKSEKTFIEGALSLVYDRKQALQSPLFRKALQSLRPDVQQHEPKLLQSLLQHIANLDVMAQYQPLAVPSLLIQSEHDPVVPYARAQLLGQKVKPTYTVSLPYSGHLPFIESPFLLYTEILRFFAENE